MRTASMAILAATALASCDDGRTLLVVDLRTDLVVGVEIDAVRTEIVSGSGAGRVVDHAIDLGADYVAGARVAELAALERGELTVRVVLLRDGAEIVARPVRVTLAAPTMAITVAVTRDCRGVECPAPDGDPIAEACVGGVCGDPRCTEEQPDACEPECVADADCATPPAACASARCVAGACLAIGDDAACGAGAYCEAETGCRPRDPSLCPPFPGTGPDLRAFGDYTCVLSADEPLRCWGGNNRQLGAPALEPAPPREVQPAHRWLRLALGSMHWCGIDQSGSQLVQCVGTDWTGQLGNGVGDDGSSDLVQTAPPLTGIDMSAAEGFTCAIAPDGRLSCWGANEAGQVGADSTEDPVWVPTLVTSTETWAIVDASGPHACGITDAGALYCWGSNANAELAQDPPALGLSRVPLAIGSDTDWVEVSVGREHVLARKSDGTVWSWGGNFDGQLGREGTPERVLQVGSATDWEHVEAGFRHSCGLRAGGALWCWGANRRGQLTSAVTVTETNVPTRVAPERTWVDVALGFGHTCALDDTDRVWCWGANDEEQLGAGPGDNRATPATVCP